MSETSEAQRGDDTAHADSQISRRASASRQNASFDAAPTTQAAPSTTAAAGSLPPMSSPFGNAQSIDTPHDGQTCAQHPTSAAEQWQRASRKVTDKGRIRFTEEQDPQINETQENRAPDLQRASMASKVQNNLSRISSTLSLNRLTSTKESKEAGAAFAEVVKAAHAHTRQQLDSAAPAMRAVPSTKVRALCKPCTRLHQG